MFSKNLRAVAILILFAVFVSACGETPNATPGAAPGATNTAGAPAAQATDTTAPAGQATNTAAPAGQATTAPTAAQATTAATEAPPSGNAVTMKVFAQQGAPYKLESNSFTQELEKKFNIKFNWQTTTWDNTAAKEARQIQLASGDYPDLYLLIP